MEESEIHFDDDMEPDPELNRWTNAIIGAAIAVHRELGPGHVEVTYDNALDLEFRAHGIPFRRQVVVPIFYRGQRVGTTRLDFIVAEAVVVESNNRCLCADPYGPMHLLPESIKPSTGDPAQLQRPQIEGRDKEDSALARPPSVSSVFSVSSVVPRQL